MKGPREIMNELFIHDLRPRKRRRRPRKRKQTESKSAPITFQDIMAMPKSIPNCVAEDVLRLLRKPEGM